MPELLTQQTSNSNIAPQQEVPLNADPDAVLALGGLASVARQERNAQFNTIHTQGAITETLEIFEKNQLLARAMDGPRIEVGSHRLELPTLDTELSLMRTAGGMEHASATLLIAGERIPVYKTLGFLVDSNRVAVEHIAETDSGSRTDAKGCLVANATDLTTLEELANRIKAQHSRTMNEVNITLDTYALRGLFTTNNQRAKLDVIVMQEHIQRDGQGLLPLFIYDDKAGTLQSWAPDTDEITGLLSSLKVKAALPSYREALSLVVL